MKRLVNKLTLVCTALALLALGAFQAPASVHAADAKPVVVVSLAGYDALRQDLGFVGALSGAPKLPEMAEGFLTAITQGNGLDGLDKKKPIGAAAFFGEGKPSGYVFIPIEDADKLLESLQNFVVDLEDLGEGYSTFKLKNSTTLTLRETKGWAFVSLNKELLADVPADPAALLGDLPKTYDVALKLNIGNLPPELIEQAVVQMRVGATQAMRKSPVNGDEKAEELSKAMTESMLKQVEQGLKDLDSYTVGLAIDGKSRSVYFDVQVELKDGSKLAGQLNDTAENAKPSTLPGLADAARVFNMHVNSPIGGDDVKNAVKLLEEGRKIGAQKIDDKEGEGEAKLQKKLLDAVIDVAVATLEGGQINGGAVVTGAGPFSVVAGFHVVDAKKLEKVLKEVLKTVAENDANAPEIEFDADTKSGITYHTVALPEIDDEEKAENSEKFFGTDELTLAIGFGEKRILIAIGDDPIEAADEVVNAKPATKPSKQVPMQMQLKVGPLLKLGAEKADKNQEALKVIVDSLADSEKDHINLTALLIKNGERIRFEIEEDIIAAFGKAVVAASKQGR